VDAVGRITSSTFIGDARNAVGVAMDLFAFSQGSSFLATLGCGDAIPLGLTGGARMMLDEKQEPRITPIRPMNTK